MSNTYKNNSFYNNNNNLQHLCNSQLDTKKNNIIFSPHINLEPNNITPALRSLSSNLPSSSVSTSPSPNSKKKQKRICIKSLKKETYTSLNEVEYFLNNFSNFIKYIKLFNLLK